MAGHRLKRDMIVSLCFTLINAFAMMWVIRVAGTVFPPFVLGLFLLARRLSSVVANLLNLGMSQTLLRYLSLHFMDEEKKRLYVGVALLIWLGLVVLMIPIFYAMNSVLSVWAFSSVEDDRAALIFWVGVLALNNVLSFITYSTFLAERRLGRAYIVEFMNVSGFLLLALLEWGKKATPIRVLQFHAVAMMVLSLSVLVLYLRKAGVRATSAEEWKETLWVFISYGMPRTLIPFLEMLTLLIGPWLLRAKLNEAGFLVITLTLIQIIQVAITPMTQIASVAVARLIGAGDQTSVGVGVRLLFGVCMYATIFTLALLASWSDHLLRFWLQDPRLIEGVSRYFDVLLWSVLPITIFQSLKGTIEMLWLHPFNLYTLLFGVGIQVGLYALLSPRFSASNAACISILAAYWGMGFLTLIWVGPTCLRPIRYWGLERLVVVVAAVMGLNFWLEKSWGGSGMLVAVGLSIAIFIVGLGVFAPAPIVRAIRGTIWPQWQAGLKTGL
jgi:O-antigen/teichoic acid export membrane protein